MGALLRASHLLSNLYETRKGNQNNKVSETLAAKMGRWGPHTGETLIWNGPGSTGPWQENQCLRFPFGFGNSEGLFPRSGAPR